MLTLHIPVIVLHLLISCAFGVVVAVEFPDKPIQLVAPDLLHKKLVLVEENVKLLHSITGPVATVAVVGKFHSGKSFLMNQLMGKSKGFGVGPSIRPETMGIWMWGKPVKMTLSSGQKASIVFLDTEGFAANNVSENYDAKIFAVATLISSHLLYNSVKIIDQADIDYLELLARRTQLFALRSQMSKAKWTNDFNHNLLAFPPLIWVVQDFVQSTDDGDSPKKWLHRLMESHTRENEDYEISLLSIFSSIDCHTLFLPAVKKDLLMDLSKASEDDLTDDYKQERADLITKLRANIVPKEKNDKSLTGREIAGLLEILVTASNEGSLVNVPSRWNVFVEQLEQSATEDCLKFYEVEMAALDEKHNGGPIRVQDLEAWHNQSFEQSAELLVHLLHGLEDALEESRHKLEKQMMLYFHRTKDMNEKKIRLRCTELINKYQLKAEEYFSSVQLPVPSKELEVKAAETLLSVQSDFVKELVDLVDQQEQTKLLRALRNSVATTGQAFQMQNVKAIESILQDGVKIATEKFKEDTKASNEEPRKPKVLQMVYEEGMREAKMVFNKHCARYEAENLYKAFQALLQEEVEKWKKHLDAENEVWFKSQSQATVQELLNVFSTKTDSNHMPLPQNTSQLDKRLTMEGQIVLKEYRESLNDFSGYSAFQENLQKLQVSLDEKSRLRQQQNVEAFTREVELPLKTAKQIILLSSNNYNSEFSLRQYMEKVCILQLNEGKPQHWSSELKSSIIDHFIVSENSLQAALRSKRGYMSTFLGFFQWLLWFCYLY